MQSIIAKIILMVGGAFGLFLWGNSQIINDQMSEGLAGEVLGVSTTTINTQKVYSYAELLKMSGPKLTTLPLGDNKYTTTGAKMGYVYLCNAHKDNFGSEINGPWIGTSTWTSVGKAHVEGSVSWSNAIFKNTVSSLKRILTGNNLPINHTTGTFPISKNSEAGKYDGNPNSIKTQSLSYSLNAKPVYSNTPNCVGGGEVGVMLSGVPLFNGFDAPLRDAQAHEIQDNCDGHPQEKGEYHYHGLSSCFKNIDVTNVLGYALDGFPITGPKVATDKYLQSKNLDVCHGLTSEIVVDGKKVVTYHYVLTYDFPYSISCYRGTPVKVGPSATTGSQQNSQSGQMGITPPQSAIDTCTGKQNNSSCTVQTPNGNLAGTCNNTPDGKYFACIPSGR